MLENVKPSAQKKSYGQYCALARSLDIVGDRWNLLIIRELLPGPLRYGELRQSLPGIATNLLAQRLKALEHNGVVERRLAVDGVAYALTAWGAELRRPMEALALWGARLLASGRGDDDFRPRWLASALPALLREAVADPAQTLGVEVDGLLLELRLGPDGPIVLIDPQQAPTTVVRAREEAIIALAAGQLSVDEAAAAGFIEGDVGVVRKVFERT